MMRQFAAVILGLLWAACVWAQTPNQNLLRMNGGFAPAYYCNYALGSFCGGESYMRSGTIECVNSSGVYAAIGANSPCFEHSFGSSPTQIGLRIWQDSENYALYSRDLTQSSAWTLGATMTAAKTATGIDGVANSATLLTAGLTSATDTVVQAITLASASDTYEVWIKGVTLTGAVNLSLDNGTANYVAATSSNCSLNGVATAPNTTQWVKCVLGPTTLTNPSIRVKIANSGDAIDVDSAQLENVGVAGPPIFTTASAVAAAEDNVQIVGPALTAFGGTSNIPQKGSAIFEVGDVENWSASCYVIRGFSTDGLATNASATSFSLYNGHVLSIPSNNIALSSSVRVGFTWGGVPTRSGAATGGSFSSDNNSNAANLNAMYLGNSGGGTRYLDGYVLKEAVYSIPLSESALLRDVLLTTRLH